MDDSELTRRFIIRDGFNKLIENRGIGDKLSVEVDDQKGNYIFSKLFPLREVYRTGDYHECIAFIEGFRIALDN